MLNFRLPVIAAVNGPAVGLGASLVLSSDLIVMSERSYLCDPEGMCDESDISVARQMAATKGLSPCRRRMRAWSVVSEFATGDDGFAAHRAMSCCMQDKI